MDYDTSKNLNNLTMDSFSMDSLYPYLLFTKILLLLLDTIGLVVNGFGIDLMWHGIEINHAVYSLVLQDIVLCWLSSFLWFVFNWIWWSSTGFTWFRMYLLFTILPLIFHDFAWSTIAYLRYLNVTDNESWLEIDQEKLRSRTSVVTWAATAVTLAILLPVGHHLIEIDFMSSTEDFNYIIIEAMLLLALSLVPYIAAFWFYYRIFKFARHVKAVETTILDDSIPATRQSPIIQSQMVRRNDGTARETIEAVNVIVDDSSDDDLIEIGESQCVKQETCAYLAIKSLLALCLIKCLSIVGVSIFATTTSSSIACAFWILVSITASITRHPVILLTSIWNFGPLRNTVGLYIENLPDHVVSLFASPLHRWKESLKHRFSKREDQRGIVVSAYDSDSSCSDDDTNSRRRGSTIMNRRHHNGRTVRKTPSSAVINVNGY